MRKTSSSDSGNKKRLNKDGSDSISKKAKHENSADTIDIDNEDEEEINKTKERIPLQDISNLQNRTTPVSLPNHFHHSLSSSFSSTTSSSNLRVSSFTLEEEEYEEETEINNSNELCKEIQEIVPYSVSDTNHATEVEKSKSATKKIPIKTKKASEIEPLPIKKSSQSLFQQLTQREEQIMVSPTYMEKQRHIDHEMRSTLIDWLNEVAEDFKYKPNVLFLAICYVDGFLNRKSMFREKFQLLGIASLIVASCQEKDKSFEIEDFVYLSDNTYSADEILSMEEQLNKVVGKLPSSLTMFSFLCLILEEEEADEEIKQLSQYLCELAGQQYSFLKYEQSRIAASALCLSLHIIGLTPWSKRLEAFSGYSLSDLDDCVEDLLITFATAPASQLVSAHDKFSRPNPYLCVASFPAPTNLPII